MIQRGESWGDCKDVCLSTKCGPISIKWPRELRRRVGHSANSPSKGAAGEIIIAEHLSGN
ncbi:hypothetical protein J6590_098089 [Homalodisca vitripennis]|nr:hypothetical protein J6590_098089 [Homalodisca vitripennis]